MLFTWLHLHAQHTLSFPVFPCSKDPFTKESCIFAFESAMLGLSITRVRDKKRLEKVGNLVKNSYLYR